MNTKQLSSLQRTLCARNAKANTSMEGNTGKKPRSYNLVQYSQVKSELSISVLVNSSLSSSASLTAHHGQTFLNAQYVRFNFTNTFIQGKGPATDPAGMSPSRASQTKTQINAFSGQVHFAAHTDLLIRYSILTKL